MDAHSPRMAQYDRLAVTVNNMEGRLMGVLDGKVAIVTGTSRGVGVGIAHELLRAGATVVGCSRSPLDAIPGITPTGRRGSRSGSAIKATIVRSIPSSPMLPPPTAASTSW